MAAAHAGPGGRCPVAGVGHGQGVELQQRLGAGQRWEKGESTGQGKSSVVLLRGDPSAVPGGWRKGITQLPRSTSTLLQGREPPCCPRHTGYLASLLSASTPWPPAAANTRAGAEPCQ